MPAADQILGPFGATVLLLAIVTLFGRVIQVLWNDHQKRDAKDSVTLDRAIALSEAQVAATNSVAEGQKELNAAFREYIREASKRHRAGE